MKVTISKALFLIVMVMTGNAYSQNNKTFLALVELKGKHGCIDVHGKEVIPVTYDDIGFWGSNLIPVNKGAKEKDYLKKGGKWGYCDTQGKLKIPLQFDEAETFQEGKAAVCIKNKWGFIDTTGKMIIPPQYDEARIFQDGLCVVAKGKKWGIIDAAGKEVVKFEYGELFEFKNGLAKAFVGEISEDGWEESPGAGYCLINKKGERLFEPKYKSIGEFRDGLAPAKLATGNDSDETKYGYINEKGELVIPAVYDHAEEFTEGMAVVGVKIPGDKFISSYQYGLINKNGEVIVKPQYSRVTRFEHGKAVVEKGGREFGFVTYSTNDSIINHETLPKCALIDTQGNFILNFDWQQLYILNNDLLIAHRAKYNGMGVINNKGEVILPFDYVNLKEAGNDLFISQRKGGRENECLVVDINNKILFKSNIYFVHPVNPAVKLLFIRSEKTRKCGLINVKGQIVLNEKYDSISDFYETE